MNNQSICLADLGRWEEALDAVEQAVAIHRQLARDLPGAFTPGLARSLNNLAATLSELGRDDEATAARVEAGTTMSMLKTPAESVQDKT